ncbi:hypothetical protein [Tsukamurella sp. PLM1]|uniref:hypothetical protein n=1 Tax=Tsukamurella sp. PLM1 TaxID=2929795 RepID=UPI00206E44C5|nr:hypothetical protein [Tsukamurella sp. PLM1]BDH56808.1 hypothetical protein MTP03_17470 [Tsukamurella sp. PLM1]
MNSNISHDDVVARLDQAVSLVLQYTPEPFAEESIRDLVCGMRPTIAPDLADSDLEELLLTLINRHRVEVEVGTVLRTDDYEPWLVNAKQSIDWSRWLAYKTYLAGSSGMGLKVLDRLDESTDAILDLAGDPTREGSWARRGLVLGDVQSGKTATYLGLLNKAIDCGYRIVIVLAGNTESLRQQTQERVDSGIIGRDSSTLLQRPGVKVQSRHIGVGTVNPDLPPAFGMTTVTKDFTRSSDEGTNFGVRAAENSPWVFVLKKNRSVLGALLSWLNKQVGPDLGHDSDMRVHAPR